MYIFDGPELQSFGVGADLLQGIQNILEGRALIFGDDAVLGDGNQGSPQGVDIF